MFSILYLFLTILLYSYQVIKQTNNNQVVSVLLVAIIGEQSPSVYLSP